MTKGRILTIISKFLLLGLLLIVGGGRVEAQVVNIMAKNPLSQVYSQIIEDVPNSNNVPIVEPVSPPEPVNNPNPENAETTNTESNKTGAIRVSNSRDSAVIDSGNANPSPPPVVLSANTGSGLVTKPTSNTPEGLNSVANVDSLSSAYNFDPLTQSTTYILSILSGIIFVIGLILVSKVPIGKIIV